MLSFIQLTKAKTTTNSLSIIKSLLNHFLSTNQPTNQPYPTCQTSALELFVEKSFSVS